MTEIYMVTWCTEDYYTELGYSYAEYIVLHNLDLDLWVEDDSYEQLGNSLQAYGKGPTTYYNSEHDFCYMVKVGYL